MTENLKLIVLVLLVVAGIVSHFILEKRAVSQAIIVTTTKIETEYKTKLIAAQQKAADQTSALNTYKVQADKDKTNEINRISAEYEHTISSLSDRPTRADLTSSVASAVARARSACTGAQLFKEDGGFLAGEAARADKIIVERDYYYGRYEDARRTLAGEKPDARLNEPSTHTKSLSGSGVH